MSGLAIQGWESFYDADPAAGAMTGGDRPVAAGRQSLLMNTPLAGFSEPR
jgi:hypothetical protein